MTPASACLGAPREKNDRAERALNIGIAGLGKMGILHAGILNSLPNSKVRAICEKERVLAIAASRIIPKVRFYQDVAEMIRKESLDVIFITSPIHTHVPIIRTVLESSRMIGLFTEKPLAANGPEALEAAEAVTKRGIVNMVGFQKRFSPVLRHAKHLLDNEAIGDVQFFRCYSYVSDIFRQGNGWRFKKGSGGALLELGPHLLDVLLWYFGEPESVSAIERSFYSSEVDDYVHAIVEFESGVAGNLDVSWSMRNYRLPEILIEVQGTDGSLTVTDDYVRVHADNAVSGVTEAGTHTLQKPAFNTSVDFLLADPEYTMEDKYFLKALQDHTQVETDFNTAARVNRFIDLIHQKAAHEA